MADAGFYRGTSSEQDSRFTDKERKLLKQMRFEGALDEKICMDRVNLDVLKPWITAKLNEILGMEDDVLIEYVFSQLEEKTLNPKVMQINLTGFLNARRAREFMGELWTMLLEAQNTADGIPTSLVETKMKELQEKTKSLSVNSNGAAADMAGSDWKNRYESLTGGRYSAKESKNESSKEYDSSRKGENRRDEERRRERRDDGLSRGEGKNRDDAKIRDREDDERRTEKRRDKERESRDEKRTREEKSGREERSRQESRSPTRRRLYDEKMDRKKGRSRSRTPKKSPPRRKFTEKKEESRRDRSRSVERHKRKRGADASDSEVEKKKKKHKRSKKHSSGSDSEKAEKKRKKHKKEKKRKKKHHSSDSD